MKASRENLNVTPYYAEDTMVLFENNNLVWKFIDFIKKAVLQIF